MTEYVAALLRREKARDREDRHTLLHLAVCCACNERILLFKAKIKELESKDGGATEVAKVKAPFSFEDGMRCCHSTCRGWVFDRRLRHADVGSNNSGYYELAAVLTHKGRSSDSGHYVGWVRNPEKKGKCSRLFACCCSPASLGVRVPNFFLYDVGVSFVYRGVAAV